MSQKDDEQWLATLEKDDRDWLNLLAGKEVPNVDSNTLREARGFREAIRAENQLQHMKARLVWYRLARRIRYHITQTLSVGWECIFNINPKVAIPATATLVIGVVIGWLIRTPYYYNQAPSVREKSEPPSVIANPQLPTTGLAQIIEYSFDDPEQVIAELKEEFVSSGAKPISFQIDIQIPEEVSNELLDLSDSYDIDLEKLNKSGTRVVRFIVSPE